MVSLFGDLVASRFGLKEVEKGAVVTRYKKAAGRYDVATIYVSGTKFSFGLPLGRKLTGELASQFGPCGCTLSELQLAIGMDATDERFFSLGLIDWVAPFLVFPSAARTGFMLSGYSYPVPVRIGMLVVGKASWLLLVVFGFLPNKPVVQTLSASMSLPSRACSLKRNQPSRKRISPSSASVIHSVSSMGR